MKKTINPEDVKVTGEVFDVVVKKRLNAKERAKKHIDRISARRVNPNIFEAVLTAYAAVGLMKYDDVLEMSDSYANSYITREEN